MRTRVLSLSAALLALVLSVPSLASADEPAAKPPAAGKDKAEKPKVAGAEKPAGPEKPKPAGPAKPRPANRLAKETSPYLLQHAHNPVDWYPWGDEALAKAKKGES